MGGAWKSSREERRWKGQGQLVGAGRHVGVGGNGVRVLERCPLLPSPSLLPPGMCTRWGERRGVGYVGGGWGAVPCRTLHQRPSLVAKRQVGDGDRGALQHLPSRCCLQIVWRCCPRLAAD